MDDNTLDRCNSTFKDDKKILILSAMSSCALLSIIISILTVAVVVGLRLHKRFVYRLTLYQVCGSLVASLSEVSSSLLMLPDKSGWFKWNDACLSFAFFLEYGMWVKLLSTMCLVFHLFCLAVFTKDFKDYELVYVALPLVLPLLFIWVPFVHNVYGPAGAWCWIKDWRDDCSTEKFVLGIVEQFILWYAPLFISLIVVIVAVVIILITLAVKGYSQSRRVHPERELLIVSEEKEKHKKALKQLLPILTYPGMYFILCLLPFTNRLYSAISLRTSYQLALGHSVSIGLWGFFSSIGLLLHVLILKRFDGSKKVEMTATSLSYSNNHGLINAAKQTVYSTMVTSRFSIPAESVVDAISE